MLSDIHTLVDAERGKTIELRSVIVAQSSVLFFRLTLCPLRFCL